MSRVSWFPSRVIKVGLLLVRVRTLRMDVSTNFVISSYRKIQSKQSDNSVTFFGIFTIFSIHAQFRYQKQLRQLAALNTLWSSTSDKVTKALYQQSINWHLLSSKSQLVAPSCSALSQINISCNLQIGWHLIEFSNFLTRVWIRELLKAGFHIFTFSYFSRRIRLFRAPISAVY